MILDVESICGAIDNNLAELLHTAIAIVKVAIPLLLIIFGMLDLGKGVIASKEDEIKSGQRMFIKRLISAILVFFVVAIVQLVIGLVDEKNMNDESEVWECANLILNGKKVNNTNNTNNTNHKTEKKYITESGLECETEQAMKEYNICYMRNSSENEINKTICGTIFKEKCSKYKGTMLWNKSKSYNEEIVNKIEWYGESVISDIELIKQNYYDCTQSYGSEEQCKNYFTGFYKIN